MCVYDVVWSCYNVSVRCYNLPHMGHVVMFHFQSFGVNKEKLVHSNYELNHIFVDKI